MTISVNVVAHSRANNAPDLITLQCRYPRFIHAEAKTHRVMNIDDAEVEFLQEISFMDDENLSRNASSSRAIPIERMIRDVIDDPAMPVAWGTNKPGMQAGNDLGPAEAREAEQIWLLARNLAVNQARSMVRLNAHKQIVNRLLEPFGHITVVVTATEWDNFFALRCHPDADPTMRALAEAMRDAIATSVSAPIKWHLPYIGPSDWDYFADDADFGDLALISAARCARVSYLNHDGTAPDIEKDLALAKRLLESKHMSPFEHQARLSGDEGTAFWRNFVGWDQHRAMLEAT